MENSNMNDFVNGQVHLSAMVKRMKDSLHLIKVNCATMEVELATLFNPELMQVISRADDKRRQLTDEMVAISARISPSEKKLPDPQEPDDITT